jgi:PIN domain nuclease of toxin-antitoxin system
MAAPAVAAILHACRSAGAFVSPVSAWEVGFLSRGSSAGRFSFLPDPKTWFARLLAGPGIRSAAFTPAIAIDAAHLPGDLHRDPADRLLIATARHLCLPIVTRDSEILTYARQGHGRAIAC